MKLYQKIAVTAGFLVLGLAGIVSGQDNKQSLDEQVKTIVGQNVQLGGRVASGDFDDNGRDELVVVTPENRLRAFSYYGGKFWEDTTAIPKSLTPPN